LPSPLPPTAILFSLYDLEWTRIPQFRLCDSSVLVHGVTPSLRWYWYSLFNETKADCAVAFPLIISFVYDKFTNSLRVTVWTLKPPYISVFFFLNDIVAAYKPAFLYMAKYCSKVTCFHDRPK
jgi:hypothetical protein